MKHEHPHRDDESGAALILAIAFIFVFSIILTGVLGLTDASLQTGLRIAGQRDLIYGADSAVEAAINHVRNDATLALDETALGGGRECWPAGAPFVAPTTNGVTVEVTCEAGQDSGVDNGVGATPSSAPGQAILTLGGGDSLRQASNAELLVGGHVHVHGNVTADSNNARLVVTRGDLRASGSCPTAKVSATDGVVVCGPSAGPKADPLYPLLAADGSPLTVPPPRRTVPPCTTDVVVFQPGWYDDATALTNCTGNRVLHFLPGVYYFDFQASTSKEWLVSNSGLTIIGGTAATATPNRDAGCLRQPAATVGTPGVQFVFGGESRLNVTSGHVELCPTVTTNRQQISIYGVRADLGPGPQSPAPTSTTGTSQISPTTAAVFTNPDRGARVDGQWALAQPLAGNVSAMLRVSAFTPAVTIPAGSTVQHARLRITHRETDLDGVAAKVTSAGGDISFHSGSCKDMCLSTTTSTDVIDLTSWVAADLRRVEDLAVEYTATANKDPKKGINADRKAELDGISFEFAWTPPILRATSGCAATGDTCPVVRINGAQSSLGTAGTIYIPRGHLYVNMSNATKPVFTRGITARSAELSITPSATAGGPFPLVSTPAFTPGGVNDRNATFTATCVSTDSAQDGCPSTPTLTRAEVTFDQETAEVTIERWRASSGGLVE
jgi:hypothetical protein